MKSLLFKISLCIAILFLTFKTFAQNYEYSYDNNGNRITRQIVQLKNMQANNNKTDSTPAIQQDKLGEMVINVLPNPTQGKLMVNISNLPDAPKGSITIWDLQGKKINEQDAILASNVVDLYAQARGSFIMVIIINGKRSEWKIIKQ
jgi:hypothetical protein